MSTHPFTVIFYSLPCTLHSIFTYAFSAAVFLLLRERNLEVLTKVLHKYRVIVTLLRFQGFYFFVSMHPLKDIHNRFISICLISFMYWAIKNYSEDVGSLKMIRINYLHEVLHSLKTFLKKKGVFFFCPKRTPIPFHKIQYFGADRNIRSSKQIFLF